LCAANADLAMQLTSFASIQVEMALKSWCSSLDSQHRISKKSKTHHTLIDNEILRALIKPRTLKILTHPCYPETNI